MKRSLFLFFIPFIIILPFSFTISEQGCSDIMQKDAEKKLIFKHKYHLKNNYVTGCNECHSYDNEGRFTGIPTVKTCTGCHKRNGPLESQNPKVALQKPAINKFKDTDKPWESWAAQPDLVYFSHKVVMTARFDDGRKKVRCASCHGDKANSNDTKMIKGKMLMGQCMDCHTALHISNKCAVCHD